MVRPEGVAALGDDAALVIVQGGRRVDTAADRPAVVYLVHHARFAARLACEESCWADTSPLSSCRGPQAALNLSYRSDRVTRS